MFLEQGKNASAWGPGSICLDWPTAHVLRKPHTKQETKFQIGEENVFMAPPAPGGMAARVREQTLCIHLQRWSLAKETSVPQTAWQPGGFPVTPYLQGSSKAILGPWKCPNKQESLKPDSFRWPGHRKVWLSQNSFLFLPHAVKAAYLELQTVRKKQWSIISSSPARERLFPKAYFLEIFLLTFRTHK